MEFCAARKKNEIVTFAGNQILREIIILSKISQAQEIETACLLSYTKPAFKITHVCGFESQNQKGNHETRGRDLTGRRKQSKGINEMPLTGNQKSGLMGREQLEGKGHGGGQWEVNENKG